MSSELVPKDDKKDADAKGDAPVPASDEESANESAPAKAFANGGHEREKHESVFLDNLHFGYPGLWNLGPLNLALRHGEFWGMIGPNGAGKSTLMKTILGLTAPLSGRVNLGEMADRHGGISYVPQQTDLACQFPVSSLQVVLMGLAPKRGLGRPYRKSDREKAMEALKSVGLERAAHQPFRQLSGGERQRTLLARALVGDPGILMLDEPTTGMDVDAGRQILHLITDLSAKGRQTVLMISHMLEDIREHTHKVIYVHRIKGIIRIGAPEEILAEAGTAESAFADPMDCR